MTPIIHGSLSVWQVLALVGWILAMRLSAMTTDDLDQTLGQAFLDSLHLARITVKDAASTMWMDESNLRKAARGEPNHHLSLTRLVRLPFAFWLYFGPTLIYLVAKRNAQAIAEDLKLTRSA